ncbi:glucose 1-dehydrogenase [Asaia sp. BMEF1]|uniref:SDR family NAD(P)-dependent oxidoreductase n=1 Tax=Asaia sp. BMEF1 TaxID=3155932 RepID=UPI003F661C46
MTKNKVALVTGASKGIGAAIVKELAQSAYTVFVNYSRDAGAATTVAENIITNGGAAEIIRGDVSDPQAVATMFETIRSKYGRIDVLVNNAGTYATAPLSALNKAEFDRHFELNVFGTLLCSMHASALFGEEGGSIINIGSSVTSFTPENSVIYTASKGAVDAITRTLSKELGSRNVRVNSINPGLVSTEGLSATGFSDPAFHATIKKITPLGRIGAPGDIAPAVVFLASDAASWITGEILVIGGGLH